MWVINLLIGLMLLLLLILIILLFASFTKLIGSMFSHTWFQSPAVRVNSVARTYDVSMLDADGKNYVSIFPATAINYINFLPPASFNGLELIATIDKKYLQYGMLMIISNTSGSTVKIFIDTSLTGSIDNDTVVFVKVTKDLLLEHIDNT